MLVSHRGAKLFKRPPREDIPAEIAGHDAGVITLNPATSQSHEWLCLYRHERARNRRGATYRQAARRVEEVRDHGPRVGVDARQHATRETRFAAGVVERRLDGHEVVYAELPARGEI